MNKIVAICGPTAVGKTAYSIEIAKKFDGEIVSCDSMQLYKYMDIGSAKPSPDELNQVKHHLIGIVDPSEQAEQGYILTPCSLILTLQQHQVMIA